MAKLSAVQIADELTLDRDNIVKNHVFDAQKIYQLLDSFQFLDHPAKDYLEMTEEDYYDKESDKLLTLQEPKVLLKDLHDRILTNHVDGFVEKDDINLTYNHEDPYLDHKYSRETDFEVLSYSLKVISALEAIIGTDEIKKFWSKDAALSLALAAYNLDQQ